jgi:hypothetical protein
MCSSTLSVTILDIVKLQKVPQAMLRAILLPRRAMAHCYYETHTQPELASYLLLAWDM